MKKRKHIIVPRVKIPEFSELSEGEKDQFLSEIAQIFDISSLDEFFKMDVSQIDDDRLSILIFMNLDVIEIGGKYVDLYPFVNPYDQREPFKPSLPPRETELCIIRTGWLCQAGYECIHHIVSGLEIGFTVEEIVRIFEGPDAPGWGTFDSAILRATDELHNNYFICDDTWDTLSEQYDEHQKLEFILLVGHYTKLAMLINSTGAEIKTKHSGYAELSEKLNNDKRVKEGYEYLNGIAKIYRDEIVEGQFDSATTKLNNLLMKYNSE